MFRTIASSILVNLMIVGTSLAATPEVFEVRAVEEQPKSDSIRYENQRPDGTTEALFLGPTQLLDITSVKSATVTSSEKGEPMVTINFTDEGGRRFAEITEQHLNKRIGFVIEGRLMMAPMVMSVISGGSVSISGNFTKAQADELAANINKAAESAASH